MEYFKLYWKKKLKIKIIFVIEKVETKRIQQSNI